MYQLTRVILTTVIGFETRNERLLSFLDARTASKFFDAKKVSEASTWVILIYQREPNCSLMKVYVLTMKGRWVICKKMWNRKRIHSFFTANSTIKFRLEEHGPGNVVTHQQDLEDLFPDVDIDPFKFHFRIALCLVTSLY